MKMDTGVTELTGHVGIRERPPDHHAGIAKTLNAPP